MALMVRAIRRLGTAALAGLVVLAACGPGGAKSTTQQPLEPAPETAPVYGFKVVKEHPHDPKGFTQGLVYLDGFLYEGTGQEGLSSLRKVELETGRVLKKVDLDSRLFGEGIAILNDKVYQLTWRNQTGFVYDLATFRKEREFSYRTEGWGLTHDGAHLIMSDGTATLYFLNPESLRVERQIIVTDGGIRQDYLNELEMINGEIWANIWNSDMIARIDPKSGKINSYVDLTGILATKHRHGKEDVLNGIAYDKKNDRIFVTGKNWARLFEIKIEPKPKAN